MRRPYQSKNWRILPGNPTQEAEIARHLGISPILARLLVQRGIQTPEAAARFLYPDQDHFHDPFLLPDAEVACERLKTALSTQESILVHGDYDGDGVTSAALWTRALRGLGGKVDVFVPHRKRDGYDMRVPIIEEAKANNVSIIVTTDCGIQRVDEVEHAREQGIDVIITDHHTPKANGELPKAVAVVNPHRRDSKYPFPHLAGVGVSFKLCEALTTYLGYPASMFRRKFLDLACIGTVTDIMPLMDENRIIVRDGLRALQNTTKPGLKALLHASIGMQRTVTATDIAFGLGPRLNAASRVDETRDALNLLMTKDPAEGQHLAQRLTELNDQRREIQAKMMEEAMEEIAKTDTSESRCLVVSRSGWSGGLVGLVASKLSQQFNRPCIVIGIDSKTGEGRGSARSIEIFNIFDAINSCSELLIEYGGHAHAAGLSIRETNVVQFSRLMDQIARNQLTEADLMPALEVAMEIGTHEVSAKLLEELELLAPYGHDNDMPFFVSRGLPIMNVTRMGKEQQHLKILFRAEGLNGNDCVEAVWWNQGYLADTLASLTSLDICYTMDFNNFQGARKIQFKLCDIKPPEW